ncbi:MAG: SBBP repeat-containing protein, partial [Candidatus Sulfotelmatobacter sp.]
MGNGRWSGESSAESLGKTLEKDSGKSLLWVRLLGALVALLVAGSVLLGFGSRRYAEKAVARHPASPSPVSSRLSLKPKSQARALLGQLPLIFEPNQGQADPQVKFLAHGAGYSLFLDANSAVLAMQTAPSSPSSSASAVQPSEQFVRMKLVGANPAATLAGADALPGKSNYIIGNDPQKWHSGIPQFGGVRYARVYPGIDLIFYGNRGRLEFDFRVAPGGDPSQAEMQFEGANKLGLSGGDLILTGEDAGGLRLQAPQLYQLDGDRHVPVSGRFVLRAANRVGFEIGPYDRSRELIIDPIPVFLTYFGGSGTETSPSVAVNGDGSIYIVGSTTSPPSTFPLGTTAPTELGTVPTAPNIFVAKINPSQPPSVAYATFLGGSGGPGADTSVGIGVDDGGNAYLVGNTSSTDFPTFGIPYQTAPETKLNCAGLPTCTSVFVSVLNPAGSAFIYSSYLSGNGDDQASGMTIDTKGDVFLTGTTTSQDVPSLTDAFPATYFPVPYQQTPKTSLQFFVTEVDTRNPNSVGGIQYSTYFGGTSPTPIAANCGTPPCNVGGGITVDATGNMYFSGTTNFFNSGLGQFGDSVGSDFPIFNAYQPCLDTVPPLILSASYVCTAPTAPYPTDAFVAKINPLGAVGAQLLFSTYFGGIATDTGPAIAIDSGAAHIYLTGETNTGATPTSLFNLPTGVTPFQQCLDTPPPIVLPCPTIASPAPFDAYVAQMTNPTQYGSGTPVVVALSYFTYLGGGG